MFDKLSSACKELLLQKEITEIQELKQRLQRATELILQSAIGLKIAKYDRAGLQITIGFGLQSATNILKIGLQSRMGLQGVTSLDYKLRPDYKAQRITKWYSTTPTHVCSCW